MSPILLQSFHIQPRVATRPLNDTRLSSSGKRHLLHPASGTPLGTKEEPFTFQRMNAHGLCWAGATSLHVDRSPSSGFLPSWISPGFEKRKVGYSHTPHCNPQAGLVPLGMGAARTAQPTGPPLPAKQSSSSPRVMTERGQQHTSPTCRPKGLVSLHSLGQSQDISSSFASAVPRCAACSRGKPRASCETALGSEDDTRAPKQTLRRGDSNKEGYV